MKSLIGGKLFELFCQNKISWNKLDELNDTEEWIKMKKNAFEAWSEMALMIGSNKSTYVELMHDLYIQYAIEKDLYPETLKEAVDVMRNVKFKSENNIDKVTQKSRIKMEVVN